MPLAVDVSVTGAKEKVQMVDKPTKESALLVRAPAGLPQTSTRSGTGSLQPLVTPSRPSSPREPRTPDTARLFVSDVSKWTQPPANHMPSSLTDQAWFQKYFADHVRICC